MNKEELIEELNHHDYKCYGFDHEPNLFYVELERTSLLSNHEITLLCQLREDESIRVCKGDDIAYGDWYPLFNDEIYKYEDELNEEIKLKAGIWFEKK